MQLAYVDPDGARVELPKLTPALAKLMNAARGARDPDEAWRAEYAFLAAALPGEYIAGALDGERYEDVDLAALDVLYAGVVVAYTAPAREAQAGMAAAEMEQVAGIDLEKIGRLVDAVQKMQAMSAPAKGFKAVR